MNTSSDQAGAAGSGDLILGSIVDLAGVLRGKVVPAARLSSLTGPGLGASHSWNVFHSDDALAFTGGDLLAALLNTIAARWAAPTEWFTKLDRAQLSSHLRTEKELTICPATPGNTASASSYSTSSSP